MSSTQDRDDQEDISPIRDWERLGPIGKQLSDLETNAYINYKRRQIQSNQEE